MDVLILINTSIGLVRPAVGFRKKAVAQLRPKIVGDLNNAQLDYKDRSLSVTAYEFQRQIEITTCRHNYVLEKLQSIC